MQAQANSGAAWVKVASFDSLNVRESHSMTVYDDSLCLAGDTTHFGVFCYNGTAWSDTYIEAAGAFYDAYRSTQLTVVGGKLYVDAQTGDDYYGIWEYNGDA